MAARRRRNAGGTWTSAAYRSPSLASRSGSLSCPSTSTRRVQERWFRPTCSGCTRSGSTSKRFATSRCRPMGTLQRPTARWPWSSRACVTRPAGLVEVDEPRAGVASRSMSRAIESTTGIVRKALAKPPAPCVSCPMQPCLSGIVSSSGREAHAADAQLHEDEGGSLERPLPMGSSGRGGRGSGAARGCARRRRARSPVAARPRSAATSSPDRRSLSLPRGPSPSAELRRAGAAAADHRDLDFSAGHGADMLTPRCVRCPPLSLDHVPAPGPFGSPSRSTPSSSAGRPTRPTRRACWTSWRRRRAARTFFVQGRWASAFPRLVRRIVDEGHLIGDHTYHHAPLTLMTDEGIRHTVQRAEAVIEPRAGVRSVPGSGAPTATGRTIARPRRARRARLPERGVGRGPARLAQRHRRTVEPRRRRRGRGHGALAHGDGARVLLHGWPDLTPAGAARHRRTAARRGRLLRAPRRAGGGRDAPPTRPPHDQA